MTQITGFTEAFNREVQTRLAARTVTLEQEIRQELTAELLSQVTPPTPVVVAKTTPRPQTRRAFRKSRRTQTRRRSHTGLIGDVYNFIKQTGTATSASIAEQFGLTNDQAASMLTKLFQIHKKILVRTQTRPFTYTFTGVR